MDLHPYRMQWTPHIVQSHIMQILFLNTEQSYPRLTEQTGCLFNHKHQAGHKLDNLVNVRSLAILAMDPI